MIPALIEFALEFIQTRLVKAIGLLIKLNNVVALQLFMTGSLYLNQPVNIFRIFITAIVDEFKLN